MKKKIRVGIMFGGKSEEHDISIKSSENIIKNINKDKFEVIEIFINKEGDFSFDKDSVDVVFPVLHGPFGEDGKIQGFLEILKVPFVGSKTTASAIAMDKAIFKQVLKSYNIKMANFLVFSKEDYLDLNKIRKVIGFPLFVKPSNLGSSIGISKVKTEKDLIKAVRKAFSFDNKILIEEFIAGVEIECAVLGGKNIKASLPGKIIPRKEFYSFEAKYLDEFGADFELPAKLDSYITEQIQKISIHVFKIIGCSGMARIDFFLKKDNTLILNELNTIPGFADISLYPLLWKKSGLSYSMLIEKLIMNALDKDLFVNKTLLNV